MNRKGSNKEKDKKPKNPKNKEKPNTKQQVPQQNQPLQEMDYKEELRKKTAIKPKVTKKQPEREVVPPVGFWDNFIGTDCSNTSYAFSRDFSNRRGG